MFIAYGPRHGSSPQRGDMFIGVALVKNNSSLPVSTNSDVCFNILRHNAPVETCHPAGMKHHLVGRKAINMSLLRSKDVPRRSSIFVKKTRSCSLATQRTQSNQLGHYLSEALDSHQCRGV
jgi:hypothetical protein